MKRVQEHRFIDLSDPDTGKAEKAKAMDRRSFLAAATTVAAATGMASSAFARNFGPDAEPTRYPDPDIVSLDKRFGAKLGNT